MKFSPRDYQKIAIAHIVEKKRCALFARPGMGKTGSTLAALDALYLAGESHPTLIVAPKRVAKYTWTREVKKWTDFNHLEVSEIVGTESERKAAIRRDVPIYTVNYEQLPWLIGTFGNRWPFRILVADESTKLKNTRMSVRTSKTGRRYLQSEGGSTRAGALAKIAFTHFDRFIELTGTPTSNGLKDLWGQLFFLDAGYRLGRSYGAFEERWFERVMRHRNDKFGELRPRIGAEDEINQRVTDLCLSLDPKDWFPDLLEPLRFKVTIDLPSTARKHYREMEKEMYTVIEQIGIEAFAASSADMKCRQLAAGAIYPLPGVDVWKEVHDEKIQALEEISEEAGGMPILVSYWFKSDLKRLQAAFPDGVDLATDAGYKAFMAGQARFGFGHPQSVGHGLDGLQDVTNIIVFFSGDWNLEYREQIIERIGPVRQLQSGHKRKVLIYDLIAEGTIDEVIAQRIETKCSVQEAFLSAMKKTGLRNNL